MKKITSTLCGIALMLTVGFTQKAIAQCTFVSTDGYTVTVKATPVSVIAPSNCPNGFNYNLTINYEIKFTGINIPSSLYTSQGNIYCDGDQNFFSMNTSAGTGTTTSVSNAYRNTTDCSSASVTSLKCNTVEIIVQGPGLPLTKSTCAAGGILPVSLLSFNAKLVNSNNVYLKWITVNEINNKSFTVQRSTDSRNWVDVKTVAGSLNSNANKQYEYTDESLAIGMYYYRLKQTDVSGAIAYSNIIGANVTKVNTNTDVTLSTNGDQLYFTGLGNYNDWEMSVISTTGAVVFRTASLSSSTVQAPATSAGVYVVRLRNKVTNVEKTIKFLKN